MWEQNETGLEREFSQDVRPTILRRLGWASHDPKLALGVVNEGDVMPGGGGDGPAATQEINLVVGVDAPSEVQRQMEIQQAEVRTGAQYGAPFLLGLGPS